MELTIRVSENRIRTAWPVVAHSGPFKKIKHQLKTAHPCSKAGDIIVRFWFQSVQFHEKHAWTHCPDIAFIKAHAKHRDADPGENKASCDAGKPGLLRQNVWIP